MQDNVDRVDSSADSEKQNEAITSSRDLGDEPSTLQVLTDPQYRKATGIAIMLACINQLSGLNAINFYSGVIFKDVFDGNPNAMTIGSSLTGIC